MIIKKEKNEKERMTDCTIEKKYRDTSIEKEPALIYLWCTQIILCY
jgi:hypothetical protein